MAALWQLPILFVVENNHFGMGTSERRAAKATEFYKRGDYVPGLWIDGMDVLAVKKGVAFAKEFALENGPVVLEMVRPTSTALFGYCSSSCLWLKALWPLRGARN